MPLFSWVESISQFVGYCTEIVTWIGHQSCPLLGYSLGSCYDVLPLFRSAIQHIKCTHYIPFIREFEDPGCLNTYVTIEMDTLTPS